MLSLALSLLLWLNGLIDSLGRPSVGNALNRRQLELAVLAEPSLPPALRPLLAGREPLASLEQALKEEIRQAEENGTPPAAELLLEQALLLRRQGHPEQAAPLLDQLSSSASPEARLAKALQGTDGTAPELSQPLPSQAALLRLWSCEALQARSSPASAGAGPCEQERASRAAARQLLAVTVLPVLVLLLGVAALLRELWLRWRRKALPASPLAGPPLTGLDAVLLIAGGFVVVGELLTPLLISPLLGSLLGVRPSRRRCGRACG